MTVEVQKGKYTNEKMSPAWVAPKLSAWMSLEGFQDRISTQSPKDSYEGLVLESWKSKDTTSRQPSQISQPRRKRGTQHDNCTPLGVQLPCLWYLTEAMKQPRWGYESIIMPIIQAKKWRLREEKFLAQGHTASVWCSQLYHSTWNLSNLGLGATCWGTPVKFLALVGLGFPICTMKSPLTPSLSWWGLQPEHSYLPLIWWFSTFNQISFEYSYTSFLRAPHTQVRSVLFFLTPSFQCLASCVYTVDSKTTSQITLMLGFKQEDKTAALWSICMMQFHRLSFLSVKGLLFRGPLFTSEALGQLCICRPEKNFPPKYTGRAANTYLSCLHPTIHPPTNLSIHFPIYFIHSLIQQILIKCLLCARYCVSHWVLRKDKNKLPVLMEFTVLWKIIGLSRP